MTRRRMASALSRSLATSMGSDDQSHSTGPRQAASKSTSTAPVDVASRFPPNHGSPWDRLPGGTKDESCLKLLGHPGQKGPIGRGEPRVAAEARSDLTAISWSVKVGKVPV